MADKKITALTEIAAGDVSAVDLLHIVDNPSGTPVNNDGVAHEANIAVTTWTDQSVAAPEIVLETGGAVVLIALGSEGSLVWYPISIIGTGSSAAGI